MKEFSFLERSIARIIFIIVVCASACLVGSEAVCKPASTKQKSRVTSGKSSPSRPRNLRLEEAVQRRQAILVEAKQLLLELQTSSGPQTLSWQPILEKLAHTIAECRTACLLSELADISKTTGDLLYQTDQREPALDYYKQAFRESMAAGDVKLAVDSLNSLAEGSTFFGRNQEAITQFQQARNLSKKNSYRAGEARALTGLGEAYYNVSDTRALQSLEEALQLWRALNDPRGCAQTLRYLGYVQTDLSNLASAIDYYQQALPLWQIAHDLRGEAQTINAIALVHTLLGESDKAIENYDRAEAMFRQLGDRQGLATALNGKGNLYFSLDLKHALDCHKEALELSEASGNLDGQIVSHRYLGNCYRALDEASNTAGANNGEQSYFAQSVDHFERSLSLSHRLGDRRIEAYCLQDLAGVYDFRGQTDEALNYYRQSLRLSHQVKDPRGEALMRNRIGAIYDRSHQPQIALTNFNLALPLARAARDQAGESLTLYNIARAKRAEGDLNAATTAVDAALSIVESLRVKVPGYDLRSAYSASVHDYYLLKIDCLMQNHRSHPAAGYDFLAFEQNEVARARSFQDMLRDAQTKIRAEGSGELVNERTRLQQELNLNAERQMRLLSGPHSESEVAASDKGIRDLNAKYENVEAQIRKLSPHYAALIKPKPLSIPDIQQQALDPDSILLEYALGDDRSYLWVVTRDQVKSYELPGRAEIEEAARNVHALLIANQPIQGESLDERHARVVKANEQLPSQIANLSKKLLAPVAGELGTKRLLIVPDGALQYIPFQVLTASDDQRPLVVDHEIVNEPSASALALLVSDIKNRKPATKSVAVVADPVFESDDPRIPSASRTTTTQASGLAQETEFHQALRDVNLSGDGHIPRLLASRVEANAIMAVTPWRSGFEAMDFDASRATVTKTDLSNYRIVHFATHGLLNNEHPELSGIVLSLFDQQGQPQDGYLRLHDIYNLKLPVDLVVLSACNTGLGKDVRGEGLIGLTRGFMYAGASSVVASLWKVDDEATSELMRLFYGYMLRDGLSPAAALRKAQVTMSQQKPWQSPYYWAGFVIEGQYIPNERVNRFSSQLLVLWLIAAVLLSVTAFYALRRRRKIPL